MITGEKINRIVNTGAIHALYREDGKWYHHLKDFPGVLFDINGFVIFNTIDNYRNSPYLHHGEDLNIPNGISSMPGYQKFKEKEKSKILELS